MKSLQDTELLYNIKAAVGDTVVRPLGGAGAALPSRVRQIEEKTRFAILRTFGKSASIKTMTYRLAPRH